MRSSRPSEPITASAAAYKQQGNIEKYIFATAQGAGLFALAAKDYDMLGMEGRVSTVLHRGQRLMSAALVAPGGIPEYRLQIRSQLDDITKMLGQ